MLPVPIYGYPGVQMGTGNILLGVTSNGLASHPGGSSNTVNTSI